MDENNEIKNENEKIEQEVNNKVEANEVKENQEMPEIKEDESKEVKEQKEIKEGNNAKENETAKAKKSKGIFGKIMSILGKTVGIAIIVALIIITVRALVYKKYDVFGYRFYMIMSGSMEPNIHVGDAIIAKETNTKELKQQDIIAFAHNNGAVTVHRIINVYTEENKKMYETKGDNNNTPDGQLVQEQDIKGIIVAKIPNVGTALLFIQKHIYIFILVVVIIILAIIVRRLI